MHTAQLPAHGRDQGEQGDRGNQAHRTARTTTTLKPLVAGILTGQIAGLVMAVVVVLVFVLFLGKGPLYPVQLIGSALLGEAALDGVNLGAVLVGLLLHQAGPSLLWGGLFGLLALKAPDLAQRRALPLGIALGVVAMVGPYVLIPFVMNTLHGVDLWNREVPILWDWAAHLVFGAVFAVYPRLLAAVNRS